MLPNPESGPAGFQSNSKVTLVQDPNLPNPTLPTNPNPYDGSTMTADYDGGQNAVPTNLKPDTNQ